MTKEKFISQAAESFRVAGVPVERVGDAAKALWETARIVAGEGVFATELALLSSEVAPQMGDVVESFMGRA